MVLTQEDIQAIAIAITEYQKRDPVHPCRFPRVEETDLEKIIRVHHEVNDDDWKEAVKFFKNFNEIKSDTGKALWRMTLVLGFGTIVTLLVIGLVAELKTRMGL